MTVDHLELGPREPRPPGHGRIVVAGVLGACALGVGLGLWARPTLPADKTPAPPEPPAAESTRAALQIVIDDEPAPLGEPLEVLPADPRHHNLAPFGPRPEPVAPRRPVSGLVKVDAPVAAEPAPVLRIDAPPKVEPRPAAAPKAIVTKAPKARPVGEDRADRKVARKELRAENAQPRPSGKPRPVKVGVEKVARVEKVERTVAETARPKLKKLVKAVKAAPKTIEVKAKAAARRARKVEVAETKPEPKKIRLAKAKEKTRVEKARVEQVKIAKAKPAPTRLKPKAEPVRAQTQKKPAPRGEGPMRVAQAPNRCANADPGEALVCSDGRLGVRDRQLQQAYRNAEAAGVPASALRRQQARWLQARAAAAREAPWAVEDVYVARIAELNDLTQDAREN